jgi:hypothetical protein
MLKNKTVFVASVFFVVSSAVSGADEENPQCYTLASLQGWYGGTAEYGNHIAIALGRSYYDGKGNLTNSFVINQPIVGSTTGERTLTRGTQTGTYTVNCDGTGVITRTFTLADGSTGTGVDDFVITKAIVKDGQFLATAVSDAQRTPSAIVPGGIFLTRSRTRLPDQPAPDTTAGAAPVNSSVRVGK